MPSNPLFKSNGSVPVPGQPRVRSNPNRVHIVSEWTAALIVLDGRKARLTAENVGKILNRPLEAVIAQKQADKEFARWLVG